MTASEVLADGPRLLDKQENLRQAKLGALRRDIAEGLDSGPSEPLNMEAIIKEARQLKGAETT